MITEQRYKDRVTLLEERKALQSLLEHPAWGKLVGVIQAQVDELQQSILAPLMSKDQVFMKEYQKGQLEGRLSLTNVVTTLLEQLTYDLGELGDE